MSPALTKRFKQLRRLSRRVYRSLFFPPLVIFIAMLLVTYWSYRSSVQSLWRDQTVAADSREEAVFTAFSQRLATYEEILIGGAGLFRASHEVTEAEWHNYISTFDIPNRYPGVQALGYIKVFKPAELPGVVRYMRNQGFRDFAVKPPGQRDLYTAILYTQPERNTPARGLDLFVEASRRSAMDRARDTGTAAITEPLTPLQDTTNQKVFLLFVPQYESGLPTNTSEQRQAALRGYLYAGFRAEDFFNKLLPITANDHDMGYKLTGNEAGQAVSFYESPNYQAVVDSGSAIRSSQTVKLYGQNWTVDYAFNPDALSSARQRDAPQWIIVIGSLLAILLAQVIFLLLKARAQDLAKQRDRAVDLAKDELLSLASHQLRTPATTVKQYLGMVLQGFAGDITDQQKSLLEKAYSGNERQLFIINEMLHVAKIDAGRITLAKQRTDLTKLVRLIVTETRSEAEKAGHKLRLHVPKKPLMLNVDEHMLRMALENIINNAIKYTVGKGRIDVSLKRQSGKIVLAVADNGVGIDQRDFPKLYKLFTRLDHKLTQNVSGTGVGLYLAKHLVELHGGEITIDSTPGRGSTFCIILPVK